MRFSRFAAKWLSLLTILSCVAALGPSHAEAARKRKKRAKTEEPKEVAPEPAPAPEPEPAPEPVAPPPADTPAAEPEAGEGDSTGGGLGGSGYGATPYTQRHIVLDAGTLRVDAGPADFAFLSQDRGMYLFNGGGGSTTTVDPFTGETVTVGGGSQVGFFFGLGAAFGIVKNLEAGVVLFPIFLAPSAAYGDISVYGRYKIVDGDTEVAAQLALWIPTQTDFGIAPGLPVLFHLSPTLRLDTGAQFKFVFASGHTGVGLGIPLALNFMVTPTVFVGARTGLNVGDFSASETIGIPLGVQGGINIMEGMLDLTTWFVFNNLVTPAAPSGADKFSASQWQFGVGANFYLDVMKNPG